MNSYEYESTAIHSSSKEKETITFPQINYGHLMWVFIVGCIIGYVVETIFCVVVHGRLESRQGLLYGPFNQIYGFGAVLMTIALRPLANKNALIIFTGGALLGGIYEFACHLIQEVVFKTKSWDFSAQTFSFGGRTSLTFMVFWGLLSIIFMKWVYPLICRATGKIEPRSSRRIIGVMTAFFIVNIILSSAAVLRWNERLNNQLPGSAAEKWLDEHYPNDHMEIVYPNMQQVPKN